MEETIELESVLAPHLQLVRLRAEAALVRRLNAGYGFADAGIPSEVFLRDARARERLSRDSLRPHDVHAAQAGEIGRAIAEAERRVDAGESPLDELAVRLALDHAELALLTIAVAYELDADVRDLCHALAWRRPSALFGDVCQELAPELARTSTVLRVLHPAGTLRHACLLSVGATPRTPHATHTACTVAVSRSVLDWLRGDERVDPLLQPLLRLYRPHDLQAIYLEEAVARELERVIGAITARARRAEALVLLQGPPGAGKLAAARSVAARLGRSLAAISLPHALAAHARDRDAQLLARALGEARLRDAVVYIAGSEALRRGRAESAASHDGVDHELARRAIESYGDLAILATTERGMPSVPVARPFHLVRMPAANAETRRNAWRAGLRALSAAVGCAPELSDDAADDLASRYVIGPGAIADVVEETLGFAHSSDEPISRTNIEDAVARRLALRLGSFGTLITRKAKLDEMVLPEDVVEALGDMVTMVKERTRILERWGYGDHLGLSRGVSALFSGEPGTGKTMAASVIAGVLGLELIRIDLSAVTSKWVGETEKHLAKIFDEAQSANAMLLFDEADSLFGKRTELRSAQDRYANLEVNYVLQRMETFDGISILTTNLESAIDPAFLRRLNFRVRFPEPEEAEREELWRRLLPPGAGISDRVDFRSLAERFHMTGGHIRNAIVRAAVVAAREDRAMEPRDLLSGAHHEYAEMGKVMPTLTS